MAVEAVQKDTVPVSHSEPKQAPSGAPAPEAQTQEGAVKTEEGKTAQAQPEEGAPAESSQTGQEAQPESEQKAELSPEERIAAAIEQRLQAKAQTEQATAEGPEDVDFETQLTQQKEQAQTQASEQLKQIDEQKTKLSEQLENGDIELNKYLAENEKLTQQRYDTQREADKQMLSIDNQLSQHQRDLQNQIRSAREAYIQQNPDFAEMYESGQISEALRDPQVRNVMGDNPAAVHQYLRASNLSKENESLRQQLAQLQEQQQSAIKQSAANPSAKVGTQTGGAHPTQTTQQSPNSTGEDPMVAALRAARAGASAAQ